MHRYIYTVSAKENPRLMWYGIQKGYIFIGEVTCGVLADLSEECYQGREMSKTLCGVTMCS